MTLPQEHNDRELIALCQANNELGYAVLYKKYAVRIYNSIHRIVAHTGEAEDILQETFVAFFKEINRLNNILNLEAWIKRIAINKSISYLRKKKIEFTDLGYTELEAEKDYDTEENEIFESKIGDVKKCINELPDGYRTIVTLYLFEQIPQEEIGNMLGISHNTVRTQYHRAKKKILSSLKDKSYYE